jgi:hypothetical protein
MTEKNAARIAGSKINKEKVRDALHRIGKL